MTAYLDVDGFKLRTVMPPEDVDFLEDTFPGYLDARLEVGSALLNARLIKRYAVPFDPLSAPEIVKGWLAALVTPRAYQKRGWNPSDVQSAQILEDMKEALEQIKEAADSEVGLFELPMKEGDAAGGVTKASPLGYTETSPYRWTDRQVEDGSSDDRL